MPSFAMGEATEIFELRSASMTLVAFVLRTVDLQQVAAALEARLGPTPELFSDDAVMLDLSPVEPETDPLDIHALIALLRRHRMLPVAARGGNALQMAAALGAGLAQAPSGGTPLSVTREDAVAVHVVAPAAGATPPEREEPAASAPVSEAERAEAVEPGKRILPLHVALVIDRPLRSGQQVYARGGDLVVLAAVNFGAEVIADGSIHVYAPLRGKAIAGAKGNADARIFSTCLDAELVSIAGTYRTTENPLPAEVAGKPAQIRLEGERLVFEPLG